MSFLDIEDKIRNSKYGTKAVKAMAVAVLGIATLGAGQAYMANQAQTVQDCVVMAVANTKEAGMNYALTNNPVYVQELGVNTMPLTNKAVKDAANINVRGFTYEAGIAMVNRLGKFNLSNPSETNLNTYAEACKSDGFRQDVKEVAQNLQDIANGRSVTHQRGFTPYSRALTVGTDFQVKDNGKETLVVNKEAIQAHKQQIVEAKQDASGPDILMQFKKPF